MHNLTVATTLFKDKHRAFPVVHETGAAIDAMAEIVKILSVNKVANL
jgi:hypothetical protein